MDHPYICNIHEVAQTEDGQDFIVMEYVEGETLGKKMGRDRLSLKETLHIASEIAEALEEAHEKGIVHRDLKPTNIMLTRKGHVKVMDFGLAKRLQPRGKEEEITAALTREGTTLGTLTFMSPEQLKGKPADTRSDIFSFGILLYELLTGVHPFRTGTQAETVNSILTEHPSPLSRYTEDTSDILQHTVTKMLAKEAGERYQSVHEVRTNLKGLSERLSTPEVVPVPAKQKHKTGLLLGAILGLLVAAALAVYFLLPSRVEIDKSIAVLPFQNLSGDPENVYFSDGLTNTIIGNLSKIKDLKVISWTSSMLYKNTDKTPVRIGEELDVATLLEGTVQRQGDKLRVTAQLINAREEGHVWSEIYDRNISDLFAIQSDIAEQIASAMRIELSSTEKSRIEKEPTANLTAYDYYLKGLDYYWRFGRQSNEDAIELFKRALAEDPNFAAARAYLGGAYVIRFVNFGSSPDWLDKGIEEAETALSIDPDCSEALDTLSFGYRMKGWIHKAIETGERAVELNPNDHRAFVTLGLGYMLAGQFDKAFPLFKKGLAVSPRTAFHYSSVGFVFRALAEYEKAEQWHQQALDIQPDFVVTAFYLISTKLLSGKLDEANEISQDLLSVAPHHPMSWGFAGYVSHMAEDYSAAVKYFQKAVDLAPTGILGEGRLSYSTYLATAFWKMGERAEAEKLFEQSLQMDKARLEAGDETFRPCFDMAMIYAMRGEKDEAYRWLEEAIDRGFRFYDFVTKDPSWSDLHNDKRFQQMMAEVKADVDEMRSRVEEMEREWEQSGRR